MSLSRQEKIMDSGGVRGLCHFLSRTEAKMGYSFQEIALIDRRSGSTYNRCFAMQFNYQ
jgi:hypothetical protein